MVILCASHENESFMLLKFGQISICQNQKLQIPISMVYKPPDMILTKSDMIVLLWNFVMKSHDNLLIQIRNFFSSFTLLYFLSQIVTQIWLYVAVDFTHHIFLFHYFSFCWIYFPTKITYVTVSFTLPKMCLENPEGFQTSFLDDHVRWCCMHTEQYYQMPFVIHSWNYYNW